MQRIRQPRKSAWLRFPVITLIDEDLDLRLRLIFLAIVGLALLIILQLFVMMVWNHEYYLTLAVDRHEGYASLLPKRGEIFMQDSRDGTEYPLAINRDRFTVFADTKVIAQYAAQEGLDRKQLTERMAQTIATIFEYDEEEKFAVYLQMMKENDPYEVIEKKVEEDIVNALREADMRGIYMRRETERYYPEGNLASHVVGFVGKDDQDQPVGRYGIEGYWHAVLAGDAGFWTGERTARGRLIPLLSQFTKDVTDGSDLVLTIDRTIQYRACAILKQRMERYEAEAASLIIMEPYTGAIRAMCHFPDFDPNRYGKVESIEVYNNDTIFKPYEIGSIFKPIAVAGLLNEEKITPDTPFFDSGVVDDVCDRPIRNAELKKYEETTMTGILENSMNTGMVHIVQELGRKKFVEYIEKFGFGIKTGLDIDTEMTGTIERITSQKGDRVNCYTATASFGQGITATPLQMATAFSAIANGGQLMQPYIIATQRDTQGTIRETEAKVLREVMTSRASTLLSGMLVSVIDNGQARLARVPGYYVGGKTGTAQIAGRGGYTEDTNHSFIGFGPGTDAEFVIMVKFEKPKVGRFSSVTAAPTFAEIAKFLFSYYAIPPERE